MRKPPKYQKAARNRGRVYIDGKQILLPGEYNSPESLREYHRLVAGSIIEKPAIGSITIRYLLRCWFDAEGRKGGKRVTRHPFNLIAKHFGTMTVDEFKSKDFRRLKELFIRQGWARRYCNSNLRFFLQAVKWGVVEEHVSPDTYALLTLCPLVRFGEAHDNPEVTPVTEEIVRETCKHLRGDIVDMIQLQLNAGMRPGEVIRIRAEEIVREGDIWTWSPRKHKTAHRGRPRTIYFGTESQKILRPYLVRSGGHGLLFRLPRWQTPWTRSWYNTTIRQACKKHGIEPWHPHQLRHAAATRVRDEHGIEFAQVLLGHARLNMTEHYAVVNAEKAKKAAK